MTKIHDCSPQEAVLKRKFVSHFLKIDEIADKCSLHGDYPKKKKLNARFQYFERSGLKSQSQHNHGKSKELGPVVQSIVSLTGSLKDQLSSTR